MESNLVGNWCWFWLVDQVVGPFKLDGWDVAKLAVQALVVVSIDPLGDGDLEVVDVSPRALVADQFCLEQ